MVSLKNNRRGSSATHQDGRNTRREHRRVVSLYLRLRFRLRLRLRPRLRLLLRVRLLEGHRL